MVIVDCKAACLCTLRTVHFANSHFQDEDMRSWILSVSNYFIFFYHLFLCRNLSKPIAVQYKEKEDRYVDTYKVALVSIKFFDT